MQRRDQTEEKTKKVIKDPFLRRKVACPICGHSTEQRGLKTNLFRAESKDQDLRPHGFRWELKNLASFHPPFYYVWYCPKCYFAAGRQFYEDPLNNCFLPMRKFVDGIVKKYKEEPISKKIVNLCTSDIDLDHFTFLQAFKLHLLAIFWLEGFKEFTERDAMNLARYYLRVAWLFRDLSEDEEAMKAEGPSIDAFFAKLKELWGEGLVDSDDSAIEKAAEYYEVTLGASEVVETAVDELNMLIIVAQIRLKLKHLKPALDALTSAVTSGTRAKQELDTELRTMEREELGERAKKRQAFMAQQSSDLRALIERSRGMLDSVKEEWLAVQTELANQLIKDNSGKSKAELKQLLIDHPIEPRVVKRLFPDAPKQQKKKGLFGGLFGK